MTNIILTSPEELQAIISQTMKEELRTINSQPPEKEPELITRQETSKILGVSLPTLHNWTRSGLLNSYQIASRIRYKRNEVLQALNKVPTLKY